MAKNRYDRGKKESFHSLLLLIAAAGVFILIFSFVVGFAKVDGVSMKGTLSNGEILLMNRLDTDYRKGDIVDALLPTGEYYVKRIVAMAGDVVDINNGVLYVNGEPESGYTAFGETRPESGSVTYPYTVPDNTVFLVGDNRMESVDSRSFGAVNVSCIRGVIKYRAGFFYIHRVK